MKYICSPCGHEKNATQDEDRLIYDVFLKACSFCKTVTTVYSIDDWQFSDKNEIKEP
jgi:hypothetical protein